MIGVNRSPLKDLPLVKFPEQLNRYFRILGIQKFEVNHYQLI